MRTKSLRFKCCPKTRLLGHNIIISCATSVNGTVYYFIVILLLLLWLLLVNLVIVNCRSFVTHSSCLAEQLRNATGRKRHNPLLAHTHMTNSSRAIVTRVPIYVFTILTTMLVMPINRNRY